MAQESEALRHLSGFLKYTRPVGGSELSLSVQGYHATWNPTEQIPERIEELDDLHGRVLCARSDRQGHDHALHRRRQSQGRWLSRLNASVQFYNWWMYSNPTYANADGTSAQIRQFDRRGIYQAQRREILGPDRDASS